MTVTNIIVIDGSEDQVASVDVKFYDMTMILIRLQLIEIGSCQEIYYFKSILSFVV